MTVYDDNTSVSPKISIILPVYNGAKFIQRAIGSVLSQTVGDWELIVVDDGSTDATAEMVKHLSSDDSRIILITNKDNLGIQTSLNRGLSVAKGKYIARIDCDDVWSEADKLKKQINYLDANLRCVLVGTGVVICDEGGAEMRRYLLPFSDKKIRRRLLRGNCFVHSSVMFRKDVVLEVGGYDESEDVLHVEDYDLWLRLGRIGELANLPYYSVIFTKRGESICSQNAEDQLKKCSDLMNKFKSSYPCYFKALIRTYVRHFFQKLKRTMYSVSKMVS